MRSLVRRPSQPSPDGLPWVVLKVRDRTVSTTDRDEVEGLVESGAAEPVRAFKSHSTSRSTPARPYVHGLEENPDVESGLEAVHAQLLGRQPHVQRLLPQCFWVDPPWACPDFALVVQEVGLLVVEVKPVRELVKSDVRAKLLRTESALAALGIRYEVVSEPSGTAMRNFSLLSRNVRWFWRWGAEVFEAAEVLLDLARTKVTFGRLEDSGLLPRARMLPLVRHLCWRGDLCLDWEQNIGPDAPVWAHGEACEGRRTESEWRTVCGPTTPGLGDVVNGAGR